MKIERRTIKEAGTYLERMNRYKNNSKRNMPKRLDPVIILIKWNG